MRADLNVTPIRDAAVIAADHLRHSRDAVQVAFAPGDSTLYQVLVARPAAAPITGEALWAATFEHIVVPLNPPGRAMRWDPRVGPPHWSWVQERIVDHEHTARVIAGFLRLLWGEMHGEVTG